MPLALPKRAKTPWWAWLSGGLGVGLAAFSVPYGVTAEPKPSTSCSDLRITSPGAQTCVRRGEQTSVAVLTGVIPRKTMSDAIREELGKHSN